jgi:hypothetical protein
VKNKTRNQPTASKLNLVRRICNLTPAHLVAKASRKTSLWLLFVALWLPFCRSKANPARSKACMTLRALSVGNRVTGLPAAQ